jgi:DNA-binding response OmpR family regulator
MDVRTADSGDDAVRVARELASTLDLIVLDVMMPGRDGYAVLGELKADAATCEIPIVLLTAKAGDDDVWEGWKSGADYYITQPFSIEELMYFIDMAFGSTVA